MLKMSHILQTGQTAGTGKLFSKKSSISQFVTVILSSSIAYGMSSKYTLLSSPPRIQSDSWCRAVAIVIGLILPSAFFFTLLLVHSIPYWVGIKNTHVYPPPPYYKHFPEMTRYVMHRVNWVALSTESTHEGIEKYPFNNVFSMSDGEVCNSTGVPYLYLTELELSVKDLRENPKASMTASLAQSGYCNKEMLDPEDPRCAHVILTGEIVRVEVNSSEADLARHALFSRHPAMLDWPKEHNWFFARLDIKHIYLLDFFGGAQIVDPKDYFAATPPQPNCTEEALH